VHEVFDLPCESVNGAETGLQRFSDAITEADRISPPGAVVLVSHGTVRSLFLSYLNDDFVGPIWEAMEFAQVFRIEWEAPAT
jgi:broad specificity phosphatase PhoE